ncbi:hypothetical protein E4T44_02655 [Aureobasidium sp. EXF-8845]|nr:hypothetical protein E4T44_02655 [Aureobasidium sp. EXF-8845]KAI4855927.1 hypothetical protein E4T45_02621 [Aureobasidium sp. EXF-8846]
MESSPLLRLPLELRERILDFVMPTNIGQMNDCLKWNVVRNPTERLLLMLSRRHALVATCRELQMLGLCHHLRHTEIICDLATAVGDSIHASILFASLPSLQSYGVLNSVHGVGAVQADDYLHRQAREHTVWTARKFPANWFDEPAEIIGMYKEAAFVAFCLHKEQLQKGLRHHQMFYRRVYRLPTFTDGNALRPIKKALRGTWKRDTIDLTLDMQDGSKSLRRIGETFSLLDGEHHEKIEAIESEIERQAESSPSNFDGERVMCIQFLRNMDNKYLQWRQRVRKFHEGLIHVVMLGYKMEYNDLHSLLDGARGRFEQMAHRSYTGDQIVDAVLEMVKATELH